MSIVDFACILYALFHAVLDHGVPEICLMRRVLQKFSDKVILVIIEIGSNT
jgi:hypothetical protein